MEIYVNPSIFMLLSLEQQTEVLYAEVEVFLLAPALMWCMWAVVRSQDTDDLTFGFWVSACNLTKSFYFLALIMTTSLDSYPFAHT